MRAVQAARIQLYVFLSRHRLAEPIILEHLLVNRRVRFAGLNSRSKVGQRGPVSSSRVRIGKRNESSCWLQSERFHQLEFS